MRTTALALVGLLSCACDDLGGLSKVCPTDPCWVDDNGEVRMDAAPFLVDETTACILGQPVCNDDGEVTRCKASLGPQEEWCNAVDDDCDGQTDEYLEEWWPSPNNWCQDVLEGVCKVADLVCIDGVETCEMHIGPSEEVCNNRDDDCDGDVDDGLETEFFYPEDEFPMTVGIGECRPGVRRCIDGVNDVTPAVTPAEEECGTGDDEDCDGFVDENENGPVEASFALLLDISGSMSGVIDAVTDAVCSWASDPVFEPSRFAVILISDMREMHPYIGVEQDFADAVTTCDTLLGNQWLLYGGGEEFQLAGTLASDALSWPDYEDKHVIVFTDEHVQYTYDAEDVDVIDQCLTRPYEVGVFTQSWVAFGWQPIVDACGGFIDDISDETDIMEEKLRYRFGGGC